MIYIHKGDDTDFNNSSFLRFELDTEWDLTGWKAKFILHSVIKEIDDISTKVFDIHLSSQETKNLPLGKLNNELKLVDEEGKVKTIGKDIEIEVTNDIVDNETQTINLPILKDEGMDVNVKVSNIPTKLSQLENDVNYLSAIITDPVENQIIKFDGEKWVNARQTGGGTGGTVYHDELENRNLANQHEIGSITNLQETLDGKQPLIEDLDEIRINANNSIKDVSNLATKDEIPTKTSELTNDKGYLTEHQDISNLATKEELENKQDTLVSGTNIKTINNQSILGEGNITIEGGSGTSSDVIPDNSSLIASYAMPSDIAIDLTLGETGSTYVAPANGYFIFQSCTLNTDIASVTLTTKIGAKTMDGALTSRGNLMGKTDQWIYCFVPAKAGQTVYARYKNINTEKVFLRFIYAEGNQP